MQITKRDYTLYKQMYQQLRALEQQSNKMIMKLLASGPCNQRQINKITGLAQPEIANRLKKLISIGVVRCEILENKNYRIFHLVPERVHKINQLIAEI